jgi:hypothetical protein
MLETCRGPEFLINRIKLHHAGFNLLKNIEVCKLQCVVVYEVTIAHGI